jgi:transcriptional regulator with XRE-family HTH domain
MEAGTVITSDDVDNDPDAASTPGRDGEVAASSAAPSMPETALSAEIRRWRRAAGLSHAELAVRVGFSREYIARSERPARGVPSANLINALDQALGAQGALIDAHTNAQRNQQARRRAVEIPERRAIADTRATSVVARTTSPAVTATSPLRDALTSSYTRMRPKKLQDPDPVAPSQGVHRSIVELNHDLGRTFDAYQDSRFALAGARAAALITDVETAIRDEKVAGAEARSVLALAHQAAAAILGKCGEPELAWIAAERGLAAATLSERPAVLGSLQRAVAFSLLAHGLYEPAMCLVDSTADFLDGEYRGGLPTAVSLSVQGTMLLTGAMAAARFGDAARAHDYLDGSARAAEQLGRDSNEMWTSFGPTNVAVHRANVAAELGDVDAVLDSSALDTRSLPAERRVRHLLDIARAQSWLGDRDSSVETVLLAERIGPEHVRQHHLSRSTVSSVLSAVPGKPSITLARLAARLSIAVAAE